MVSIWQQAINHAQQLRRQIHSQPELGWHEVETARLIREQLDLLRIPWEPCAEFGTLARLNPHSKNKPHIALRADMDALPIVERTQHAWVSQHEGFTFCIN